MSQLILIVSPARAKSMYVLHVLPVLERFSAVEVCLRGTRILADSKTLFLLTPIQTLYFYIPISS